MIYTDTENVVEPKSLKSKVYTLMLYNDDVNTFDHVIDTLIKVCGHSKEQAEQCSLLVHYKGKCDVKSGTLKELRPTHKVLCEKGLSATIEE